MLALLKDGVEKISKVINSPVTRTMFSSMPSWLHSRIIVTPGPEDLSHHSVPADFPLRSCRPWDLLGDFFSLHTLAHFLSTLLYVPAYRLLSVFLFHCIPAASSHRKSQHLPEASSTGFGHPKWITFSYMHVSVEEVKGSQYIMNQDIKGESRYIVLHFGQSIETWRTNVGQNIVQRMLGPKWEI